MTSCSAVFADRCCDDIKHAMRHRADCLNTYCKNVPFSIKLYVYNCLYSISTLTGEHLHLRITHKQHACEYMFLHKKMILSAWSIIHHFVGEVLLHPVCIYIYSIYNMGSKLDSFLRKRCFFFSSVLLFISLEIRQIQLRQ